ncbi:MAG: OadG family protein [Bacteroidaceae bacterium]|nr:OadG family protein [Bacteroidaceae bacterium]
MITNDIYGAILLMAVGMITVFLILIIVITLGTLLIKLVNKYAPEEVQTKKAVATANNAVQQVDATVKAVIDATVSQITGGKGRVTKITKL